MNEAELKLGYEGQKPALIAWGFFVRATIHRNLEKSLGAQQLKSFFKIPPEPRVKDTASFLSKALLRKTYENPLDDITDRVGIRFVVLLRSQIKTLEEAIELCDSWEFKKDRDFEAETAERPHHFDYQSVHYILRAKKPIELQGVKICPGFPCEIQVRTLLQHAYAELAHDRIYKSSNSIGTDTRRDVARSAALVETTDEIFDVVDERLEASVAEVRRLHEISQSMYYSALRIEPLDDIRFSRMLLSPYLAHLQHVTALVMSEFLNRNDFIVEKIGQREPLSVLYQHSTILCIYFLVESEPNILWQKWPFDLLYLYQIYADMGVSTDGRF